MIRTSLLAAFLPLPVFGGYLSPPDMGHSAESRRHTGIPSVAVAPNGRLWVAWYGSPTGGEDSNNYCTLATSDDNGRSWRDVVVADPDGSGPKRAFDPEVWISPQGKLVWTWTERVSPLAAESPFANAGCLADPKDDRLMCVEMASDSLPCPPYPEPRQIARGVMMCKPAVAGDGTWLFPVAHWTEAPSACFYASTDCGKTFSFRGGVTLPERNRAYDEHTIVSLGGTDWLTFIRSVRGTNCMASVSRDDGRTWSDPKKPRINHTSSRLFMKRLSNEHLLLVKHGGVLEDCGRRNLTAFISRDKGRTWEGGLLLDARENAAYPDGDESSDGLLYIVYDHDRLGEQNILLAVFTEADVLAGKDVSGKVRLRQRVSTSPDPVFTLQDGDGLRAKPMRKGPVGSVTFTWSDGKTITQKMVVDVQRNELLSTNLVDSVLKIGDFVQYVRPNLRHYQRFKTYCYPKSETLPQGQKLVDGWEGLEKASEHDYKLDVQVDGGAFLLWSEGSYVGRVEHPAQDTLAKPVSATFSFVRGAQCHVERGVRKHDARFEILQLDENPRACSFKDASLVGVKAGKWQCGDVPMRIAFPKDSQDVGICREVNKPYTQVDHPYRMRSPQDGYREAIHYRLTPAQYVKAHVVFALDDSPGKDPKFVLRQALHEPGCGTGSNQVFERVIDYSDGVSEDVRRIGSVKIDKHERPLYFASYEMDIGPFVDFGGRNPFIEFELCGSDRSGKVESAVNVFALTLERLPVVLDMVQDSPGNIFTSDEPKKTTRVHIHALRAFSGSITWSAMNATAQGRGPSGDISFSVSPEEDRDVVLDLSSVNEVGMYELKIVLRDAAGRELLIHPARMCILPGRSRLSARDPGKLCPYATWWFDVHGCPGAYEIGCPIMSKAGIYKVGWRKLTPEVAAKYNLTTAGNVKILGQDAFEKMSEVEFEKAAVADLRKQISENLRTDHVLVWHEDAPARYTLPEEVLGLPVPTATDEDKKAGRYVNACGRIVRKHFPGLRIAIGNSFHSLGAAVHPLRGGANPQYYDEIGIENASQYYKPERLNELNNNIAVMVREAATKACGRDVKVNGCWEFVYRWERKLGEDIQAAYYVRDAIISLMHGYTLIDIGTLFDARNGYYDLYWGQSGLLFRAPYLYPKRAYLAYGVLTKTLDDVMFMRRIPTGSPTVYAAEFRRSDGRFVTAIWTARGEAQVDVDGLGSCVSMYGSVRKIGGWFRSSAVCVGMLPSYVVTKDPLIGIRILSRCFADEEALRADGEIVRRIDDAGQLQFGSIHPDICKQRESLPIYVPSEDFVLSTVDDSEEGRCVEVSLDKSKRKMNKYMTDAARLEFRDPVAIPDGATHIGVRVKGDSGWGQLRFEIEDAEGEIYTMLKWGRNDFCDQFGTATLDFDGWGYVYYPLYGGASWYHPNGGGKPMTFPLKLRAIVVGLNRNAVDLTSFVPVAAKILIKDVFISRAPFREGAKEWEYR